MIRNEKTGRFESETKKSYKVYSELLNKPFDTVEELEAAEAEVRKVEEEKKAAAETKKTEAEEVKKAIVARVDAEVCAKKAKAEAYKKYLEELDTITKEVEEFKENEAKELKAFCEKYGGFHETITIGDITYKCDYSTKVNHVDPIKKLLDSFWF